MAVPRILTTQRIGVCVCNMLLKHQDLHDRNRRSLNTGVGSNSAENSCVLASGKRILDPSSEA